MLCMQCGAYTQCVILGAAHTRNTSMLVLWTADSIFCWVLLLCWNEFTKDPKGMEGYRVLLLLWCITLPSAQTVQCRYATVPTLLKSKWRCRQLQCYIHFPVMYAHMLQLTGQTGQSCHYNTALHCRTLGIVGAPHTQGLQISQSEREDAHLTSITLVEFCRQKNSVYRRITEH